MAAMAALFGRGLSQWNESNQSTFPRQLPPKSQHKALWEGVLNEETMVFLAWRAFSDLHFTKFDVPVILGLHF